MNSPEWYADVPARPPPAPRAAGGNWKRTCRAVDADNGLRCQLLEHGEDGHRSERGPFRMVAARGQTSFPRAAQLAAAALSRPEAGEGIRSEAEHKRSVERESARRAVQRRRTHRGPTEVSGA